MNKILSEALTLLFVPLIGLMLYRRVRRTFGRQPVRPRGMWFRIVMLPAVCCAFLATAPSAPAFIAAGAGLTAGAVLGVVALGRTRFELSLAGRFYTPNPWIGLVVTALVLGRVAGRLVVVSSATAAGPAPFSGAQRSPLTLGLFFLMAGYYVCYYGGVLLRARAAGSSATQAPTTPSASSSSPDASAQRPAAMTGSR